MMRSKLFVPAIRPELFEKALHAGADAVCFDLEDAVPADRKAEARKLLEHLLTGHQTTPPKLLLVRVNSVTSAEFLQDVVSAVWPSVFAITLPKVESADEVRRAADRIAELESSRGMAIPIGILPTIESPRGLRVAAEIALSSPRVIGLQIGFADLLEPLGITSENAFARNQIRLLVRLAAAEAGMGCYDSAYANFKDISGYKKELESARSLGFTGGSCIHPTQVATANLAFTPTAKEIDYARRVVDAAEQAKQRGDAVTTVDGKMIDRPFVLSAQRLLARNR
jgi:citrate lyase beta subunit